MNKIKTAVVGVGYLGKYHAEKYALLPNSELIAVCDTNDAHREEVAKKLNVPAFSDYRELIGKVDAVSIVAPTKLHHQLGLFFLEHGIHVLIEKPIATTVDEANELTAMAEKNKVILQVGHLERFNNALKGIQPILKTPRFIESSRLAPFKLRGADVNVVLDLMIHDIDIIQSITRSSVKHIAASGASVLSNSIDIANARIEFENGCVANITASRISLKTERKLRIFQDDCYIGIDLDSKQLSIQRKGEREIFPGIPEITSEAKAFDKGDALKDEIEAFLDSILHKKAPIVSGEDGKRALEIALDITQIIKENNARQSAKDMNS